MDEHNINIAAPNLKIVLNPFTTATFAKTKTIYLLLFCFPHPIELDMHQICTKMEVLRLLKKEIKIIPL